MEFDAPGKLLQNPASLFTLLVEDTGSESAAMLRALAMAKLGGEALPLPPIELGGSSLEHKADAADAAVGDAVPSGDAGVVTGAVSEGDVVVVAEEEGSDDAAAAAAVSGDGVGSVVDAAPAAADDPPSS
jgi:hypothetical protein